MEKVLVVDDEASLRLLISATLEDEGLEIYEAGDGVSGLEMAQKLLPRLIILDVMMPGVTGLEVCRKLKGSPDTKDIKVLLLTAKGQESDREEAWAAGVDYFLVKPFSPGRLLDMVRQIVL